MKKALIACSLAPLAKDTIKASIIIAHGMGASLHFCHVSEETAENRSRLLLLLSDCGVSHADLMIRSGQPDKVICAIAHEINADLIIAGALRHEPTLIGIWGSIARRLVRRAHCSVLLLTNISFPFQAFQDIAVRVSFTHDCKNIVREAVQLVVQCRAKLHFIREIDYSLRALSCCEEVANKERIEDFERECIVIEQERLRDYIESSNVQGIKSTGVCLAAKDQQELKEYIALKSIDLILTLAPKHWGFWERLFNVPIESVLQDMPCSILFYRKRD